VGQNGAGHDADSRGHPPEEPLDGGLHLAKKKKNLVLSMLQTIQAYSTIPLLRHNFKHSFAYSCIFNYYKCTAHLI
jgi:hypothetical protein